MAGLSLALMQRRFIDTTVIVGSHLDQRALPGGKQPGPLGQGNLDGNNVVCPWHEWAYDCRTGENDFDPAIKLDRFPVKAEGDDILIDPQVHV